MHFRPWRWIAAVTSLSAGVVALSILAAVASTTDDAVGAAGDPNPAEAAPDDNAPEANAPQENAADEAAPSNAAPDDTAPASATPDDKKPAEAAADASKGADAAPPNLRLLPDSTADHLPGDAAPAPGPADATQAQPNPNKIKLDPAEFNGVLPGRSTTDDVIAAWGQPVDVTTQHNVIRHKYVVEPFKQILVTFYKGKVQSLIVQLQHHFSPQEIAGQLNLDVAETATIHDEAGEPIGLVFPERGVVFAFIPGMKSPTVAQVILEAIDAQSFVLRAEARVAGEYSLCQRDLDMALELDHEYGRAFWLRAVLLSKLGRQDEALRAADEAVRLEPKNPEFRLTRSKILAAAGQFARAVAETKEAIELCAARPLLKARGMQQLGDQLAIGPGRDHKRSLDLQMQAIRMAEPLTINGAAAARRAAQEILLDAHLSAARNIAWGNWKMKTKVVPKWLVRAEAIARDTQATAGNSAGTGAPAPAGGDFDFRVCQTALATCVGMEGELDPTPWAKKTLATAQAMIESTGDPLRKRQLEWELGAALYDALQVYHVLAQSDPALEYGKLAVEYLESGAQDRQLEPAEAYLLGRLYFRMGSVYAAGAKDHQQAVVWFEKAVPLLERPIPASAYADVGRQGESFVSMAVSYWAAGSHDEAMRLTRRGVKHIEEAIQDGILGEDALAIPYSNLATMHRYLGDEEQAQSFTEMATRVQQGTRSE